LRVTFHLYPPKNNVECINIPLDFRKYFISFLKTLTFDSPYFSRFEEAAPGYSPYVFGIQYGKVCKIDAESETITVKPPVMMTISTGFFDLMTAICNSAIQRKGKDAILGLRLSNIELLPNVNIHTKTIDFKIVGHIVLRSKEGYLDASEIADIEESINMHFQSKLNFLAGRYLEAKDKKFEPVKVVDSAQLEKGVCRHYGGNITSLKGRIVLAGHPDSLQFLYDYGIGTRTGQGFGLMEVSRQL